MSEFLDLEEYELDSEEVKAWNGVAGGDLAAAGEYVLRFAEAGSAVSSNGNKQLAMVLCICANADGSATAEEGKTVREWLTFTPKSKSRVKHFLQAVGVNLQGFDPASLVGKEIVAEVYHDESTKMKNDGTPFINARIRNERAV